MKYHEPALLKESIDGLEVNPGGVYVDVTFGGGGHSAEILKRLENGRLIAFDQDKDAEKNAFEDDRFLFIRQNFRFMGNFLKFYGIRQVDGIIADLGISFHQVDVPGRGFSFRFEGDLDLRMNQLAKVKASDILNTYPGEDLEILFREYGEIRDASRITRLILNARGAKPILKISEFMEVLSPWLPKEKPNKILAKVFQALRMEVNKEVDSLKELLVQASEYLKPGGRLVVLSYHSLEDRLVKNFMKKGKFEGEIEKDLYGNFEVPFKMLNKSVITPSSKEVERNKRARSAKLRIAEKI
ncbi:MAG: 16S rRNA (cytosine(1402)-N(4))-methyltransferase RsmH [Bacteroidota bacterium]